MHFILGCWGGEHITIQLCEKGNIIKLFFHIQCFMAKRDCSFFALPAAGREDGDDGHSKHSSNLLVQSYFKDYWPDCRVVAIGFPGGWILMFLGIF